MLSITVIIIQRKNTKQSKTSEIALIEIPSFIALCQVFRFTLFSQSTLFFTILYLFSLSSPAPSPFSLFPFLLCSVSWESYPQVLHAQVPSWLTKDLESTRVKEDLRSWYMDGPLGMVKMFVFLMNAFQRAPILEQAKKKIIMDAMIQPVDISQLLSPTPQCLLNGVMKKVAMMAEMES